MSSVFALTMESAEDILDIALGAGERIMTFYRSELAVTQKQDNSPLTQADMAAHRHIVAALEALTPDIPVLSEESASIPFAVRRSWTRYWLVDPLDGTREFIKRNDEFTVNIALVENGVPVLGVVAAPALGVSYFAVKGLGAYEARGLARVQLRTRWVPETPVFVVSRSHQDDALKALLANFPPHEAASRGSALKICLVAAGDADLYPRTGPTSEWDTAAGHCVVNEAGGVMLTLPELAPLRYNQKDSLLNPGFVVIGDQAYGWERYLEAR